jgi:hypothetical protein
LTADGADVLAYAVALDLSEAGRLKASFGRACANFDGVHVADLFESYDAIGAAKTHDQTSAAQRFVPGYFLNPLLSRDWNSIQREFRAMVSAHSPKIQSLHEKICKAEKLLEGVAVVKRYDPASLTWNPATGIEVAKDGYRKFDWVYLSDGGVKRVFIPVEYLP